MLNTPGGKKKKKKMHTLLKTFWLLRLLLFTSTVFCPGGYSETVKENVEKLLGMPNLEIDTFMR